MKDWSYSRLTKDASNNGGPEKYLESIEKAGEEKGRIQGYSIALLFSLPVIIKLLYDKYKDKKKISELSKEQLTDISNTEQKEKPENS